MIFLHIPKTAGTSLYHVLAKNYNFKKQCRIYHQEDMETAASSAILAQNHNFIYGHFHFVDQMKNSPYFNLSWLREPLACVISTYLHLFYSPLKNHKEIMQGIKNFDDYLQKIQPINLQSKRFSGFKLRKHAKNNDEINERAMAHFHHFDFIGITERFEESLLCLSTEISLNRTKFSRQNVQKRVDEFHELKEKYENEILAISQNDILLYQMANQALNERLKKISSTEKQLFRLRKLT